MAYRTTWKRKYKLRRAAAWCDDCKWSYDSAEPITDRSVHQASRWALRHAERQGHKTRVVIEREYRGG